MANPWAIGAWAVGALAPGSWNYTEPSANTGVVWETGSWAAPSWAEGTWQDSWAKTGQFDIEGQIVSLKINRVLTSEAGSFVIDDQDISLIVNRTLVGDTSSFVISGQDATLVGTLYRISSVNTYNEVIDNQISVTINGENLTGTTDVVIQYAESSALQDNSWGGGAWETGAWRDGSSSLIDTALTNVDVVNASLITADMFDVVTSNVPFTDINHTLHRLALTKGSATIFQYIELLPSSFYIIGTVQPSDAVTTSGTSIFGGMTLSANMQVRLPTQIAGINATWETLNGNITGRVTLASVLPSATPLAISIWEDGVGWDVINTVIRDISDVNTNIPCENGVFSITGQDAGRLINRVLTSDTGSFVIEGQEVVLGRSFIIQPSSLVLNPILSIPFMSQGMAIDYVIGLTYETAQVGSEFSIYGVGFGSDNNLDIVFVDVLGTFIEGVITQINNSFIRVSVVQQAAALSAPVTMYVGDYQRSGGTIVLSDNVPIPTSSRNVSRPISLVTFANSNLYIESVFETPTLTQSHNLAVDNILINQSIDNVLLGAGSTSLVVNGITISNLLGIPTLTQKNVLSVDSITSGLTLDTTSLVQAHRLPVNSLTINSSLGTASLIQAHTLSVNSLFCGNILGNNALIQHNVLTVNSLSTSTSIDNILLAYTVGLNVNNLRCTLTESNVNLVPHYNVTPMNVLMGLSITSSSATPTFTITVDSVELEQTLDTTSLTQRHLIVSDNLRSNTSISSSSLLQDFGTLVVDSITLNTRLSTSRAKITTDPLTADDIKSYPALSGEILINQ